MMYLSGCMKVGKMPADGVGVMMNPKTGVRPAILSTVPWAADNGCFSAGDAFDANAWRRWLSALTRFQSNCLFVVAPDVLCDAEATWERCRDILPGLRADGWKAALVAQNGLESSSLLEDAGFWNAFDCLFIGGDTLWKLSTEAAEIGAEAKRRGKWLHMGRVNSLRRLKAAASIGCDSADGTMVAFSPDRYAPLVGEWVREVNSTTFLPFWGEVSQ